MYETILVPLDGSKMAEAILAHVEELAAHYGSALIFLRVIEIPHLTPAMPVQGEEFGALPHLGPAEMQDIVTESQTYLRHVVKQMADRGITAKYRVTFGPIAAAIMNTAVEEEADLIAMASHGAGSPEGVYYGSVAAGVLQRVDRPLLIVRGEEQD